MNTKFLATALVSFAIAACGKSDSSSPAPAKKEPAPAAKPAEPPTPAEPPKPVATKLLKLPVQADVAPGWKLADEKVNPAGGTTLSTKTGEVSVLVDGGDGTKKMTLEDEKKLSTSSGMPTPTDVVEDKLADGWVYTYKAGSVLPFHGTVYRNIGAASYRCVITTEQAAQRDEGVAICKSLRP